MSSQGDEVPEVGSANRLVESLSINSYADLLQYEQEILDRIEALPNGGNLFMIHPFLLFEDIGLVLSQEAKDEILTIEPRLAGLSELPYAALKASESQQGYEVHLKGLFERRTA